MSLCTGSRVDSNCSLCLVAETTVFMCMLCITSQYSQLTVFHCLPINGELFCEYIRW